MSDKNLIEKLEGARDGSRELDAEIAIHLWPELIQCRSDPRRGEGHWIHPDIGPTYAENYTTSIDAALTLVPEGNYHTILHIGQLGKAHGASAKVYDWTVEPEPDWSCADTPALAICIAALKAREAEGNIK